MAKDSQEKIPVITLSGPTGAGKTAAALAIAQALPIAIVNADSRQVYADFPLITAQPSIKEQASCPHHLYGWLPTEKSIGVGMYTEKAQPLIEAAHKEHRIPLLVGGTGLYFKTLLEGVAQIPPVDEQIRKRIQGQWLAEGALFMREQLESVDPEYAKKIHANDKQRTTRALEVFEATGKPFSWWHAQPVPPSPYTVIKIGIEKKLTDLEPILQKRIGCMMEMGAKEEAERAYKNCPIPEAPGWSGIGCKEMLMYLREEISLDACLDLWYRNTRAYAKRQITWFKAEKDVFYFAPEQINAIVEKVTTSLSVAFHA